MFRALRRSELPMTNVFGVIVGQGSKTTMASWRIAEPADVLELLRELNELTVAEGGDGVRGAEVPRPKSA